jgi:hypothetical protein
MCCGDCLLFPAEAAQLALRLSQQFVRDKLTLTVVALRSIGMFAYNAFAARAELPYALSDVLRLSFCVVTFQPTRRFGPFYGSRATIACTAACAGASWRTSARADRSPLPVWERCPQCLVSTCSTEP